MEGHADLERCLLIGARVARLIDERSATVGDVEEGPFSAALNGLRTIIWRMEGASEIERVHSSTCRRRMRVNCGGVVAG